MKVIFTDLDGTLLSRDGNSFNAARPALELIDSLSIPLVFCTSKTRREVGTLREQLANRHPFIVENGGAAYVPKGYFLFPWAASREVDGYDVIEFGQPYPTLVEALQSASRVSGCRIRGFHDMTVSEVAQRCRMSLEQATAAKAREYDEPFEVIDLGRSGELLKAIEREGRRWTRGDAFYHITGDNDKARAVRMLTGMYWRAHGEVATLGLGDGLNDIGFLNSVDLPVVVRSRFAVQVKRAVPQGSVTHDAGPLGWGAAVIAACRPALSDVR